MFDLINLLSVNLTYTEKTCGGYLDYLYFITFENISLTKVSDKIYNINLKRCENCLGYNTVPRQM